MNSVAIDFLCLPSYCYCNNNINKTAKCVNFLPLCIHQLLVDMGGRESISDECLTFTSADSLCYVTLLALPESRIFPKKILDGSKLSAK